MKATLFNHGKQLVISNVDYIPVDDSEYGKSRKEMGKETMIDIYSLVIISKENGFELPDTAFIHNYEAWRSDYKSNFHSDGINCFSPCKCNNLSFTISFGDGETYYA